MWQTDTVILQTKSEVNTNGDIQNTWTDGPSVICDVQDISKDNLLKEFGFQDDNEWLQVFDHTNANWAEGFQCKYNGNQYWIKRVINNLTKIGFSNHTYVVLQRVV